MAASDDLTWSVSSATVGIGETITVSADYGMSPTESGLTGAFNGLATAVADGNWVEITGVAAGTVTVPVGTDVGNLVKTANAFTLTVTAPADDQNFLNERGLAHFWDNIDSAKQDKLTAGAGISITGNTISATGGGTADAVDWGNITGSMSNQTDLTTALNAKANTADLATVATSGDYDDLTDKPTIGNATLTIQKNGTSAGTFTANATSNKTINITVPTTAADVSALPASTKYGASIAVSINTTDYKVTTTLKDQDGNTLGTAQVIDLPLESVVVNGSYDNTNKKIVLTLQNGSTIDIPVADLVAGLQSEITSTNKLASDLVDDTNQAHKFMTSAEKTKLSGIAAGAEVNVQSDWDQTTTTADDYIKNKPSLATVATSGSYNDLSNKPTIPTVNNATLTIQKNGTTVKTFTANASSNVTANIIVPTKTSDITNDSNFVASGDLATVATSGSYNDLSNKPTIPAKQVFYGTCDSSGGSSSKAVACSGFTYAEGNVIYVTFSNADTYSGDSSMIMNVNSTGEKVIFTQTTSGGGLQSDHKWAAGETVCFVCHNDYYLMVEAAMATPTTSGLMSVNDKNKLDGIAAGAEVNVQANWAESDSSSDAFIKNKPNLAAVATSGSYDDLSNKPTIPAAQVQSDWAQTTTTAVDYIKNKPALSTVATSGSYNDLGDKPTIPAAQVNSDWSANSGVAQILNKPTLATVATSGSYNDLSNKPTIPTVNDATLTIQQNGTSLGTFTANASSSATIDVNAPKLTSLVGSVQTSDYHRSVIALCEVASGSGSTVNSWSSGKLVAHRNNGAYGVAEVDINIEAKRATAYYSNVSYFSNIALLSPTANINTDLGFRPCTFKYNNVYYAGIEFYISSSSASNVYFSGVGNFDVFGLDYYSVSHGSTASSVLNSEVYNSLNYTQWNEERNRWRVGRATRDIIYDNGSGTNANFSTTTAMSSYDDVEICYRDGNNNYALKLIPGPAGSFVLDIAHPGANNTVFWYISRYLVSGKNVTVGANNTRKAIGASSITTTASQDIYITRITGIRY